MLLFSDCVIIVTTVVGVLIPNMFSIQMVLTHLVAEWLGIQMVEFQMVLSIEYSMTVWYSDASRIQALVVKWIPTINVTSFSNIFQVPDGEETVQPHFLVT